MNLDELKGAWAAYDDQLKSTKEIDDQVIAGMIRKRSISTVATIKKSYLYGIYFCCFYILAFTLLNIGNPFDYTHDFDQIPIKAILGALILILVILLAARHTMKKLEVPGQSLLTYLENVIKQYRKTQKLLLWIVGIILFSASVLFPLSFLSRKIAKSGLWFGLIDTFSLLILALVLNVIYHVIAKRRGIGARSWWSFKVIIKELEELKIMAAELKNS